jgi:hypothetical protein
MDAPPNGDFLSQLEERARRENPDVAADLPRSRETSPFAARPRSPRTPGAVDPVEQPVPSTSALPADANSVPLANGDTTAPAVVKKKRPLPPTPPPKRPRKPQPTIRLEVELPTQLANDAVYELNFEESALDAGLRVVQSESEKDESETDGSDDDSEDDAPAQVRALRSGSPATRSATPQPTISSSTAALLGAAPLASKNNKRKRKKVIQDRDEGYDTSDSFVDDTELRLDMPKFYVRPKRDGFFVANGPLELLQLGKTTKGCAPSGPPSVVARVEP